MPGALETCPQAPCGRRIERAIAVCESSGPVADPAGRAGFLIFGVAVIVVTQLCVPIARRWGSSGDAEDLVTQRWLHRGARRVIGVASALRVIELWFDLAPSRWASRARRWSWANHPTALDATLIAALMPQVDMVVEVSWAEDPDCRPIGSNGWIFA